MYEILGLEHVFSTFQETIWSHLKLITIKYYDLLFTPVFYKKNMRGS